jgi:tRNA (guanine9-N1)-methyltransferase
MYTRALLERLDGFSRLALSCSPEDYMACEQSAGVPPERVVYLTAESPTLLTRLDPKVSYVIGGLVDHNRLKNLCHSNALARGVATARLPIGENMTSNGRRTVITVNQVFEILLRAHEQQQQQLADGKAEPDWAAIMKSVLPARSNWQEKRSTDAAAASAPSAVSSAAGADAEEDEEERADDERNQRALEQDDEASAAVAADADALMADGAGD